MVWRENRCHTSMLNTSWHAFTPGACHAMAWVAWPAWPGRAWEKRERAWEHEHEHNLLNKLFYLYSIICNILYGSFAFSLQSSFQSGEYRLLVFILFSCRRRKPSLPQKLLWNKRTFVVRQLLVLSSHLCLLLTKLSACFWPQNGRVIFWCRAGEICFSVNNFWWMTPDQNYLLHWKPLLWRTLLLQMLLLIWTIFSAVLLPGFCIFYGFWKGVQNRSIFAGFCWFLHKGRVTFSCTAGSFLNGVIFDAE